MADPIPMARVQHVDIPMALRERATAISVRASRIAGVLRANAALPDMLEKAKDDLLLVAEQALALRRLL